MASACVNNVSPENLLPAFGWLSPRMSTTSKPKSPPPPLEKKKDPKSDLEPSGDVEDFEFEVRRIEGRDDFALMLPADELFSEGKLVPSSKPPTTVEAEEGTCSQREQIIIGSDLFSPRAPRCSSRWRELLGLKKATKDSQPHHSAQNSSTKPISSSSGGKSIKLLFLNRNKSSNPDPFLNQPLLKDSSTNSTSTSSSCRLSLSSDHGGLDRDRDLPRLSLDSDKTRRSANPGRVRTSRAGRSPMRRDPSTVARTRGVSVDSPRMNPSGKIVFNGLERSSSSPSSFNGGGGGPRPRYNMERSYSANVVRVTPVLNVPVCSLKSGVFGLFASSSQVGQHRKEKEGSGNGGNGGSSRNYHHHHHHNSNNSNNSSKTRREAA